MSKKKNNLSINQIVDEDDIDDGASRSKLRHWWYRQVPVSISRSLSMQPDSQRVFSLVSSHPAPFVDGLQGVMRVRKNPSEYRPVSREKQPPSLPETK